MKNYTSFCAGRPRSQAWLLGPALLAATLVVGCGETEDPDQPDGVIQNPANPGATDGSVPPGYDGGWQNPGPGTGQDGGGSTDTDAGGGGGGGGSADTEWCKVKKILDARCVACHDNPVAAGAPFPLVTYEDLAKAHPSKAGKKIYERVAFRIHADKSQSEGLTSMPPGAQLPADQLAIIDGWVAAGAPVGDNPTCTGGTDPGPGPEEVWPPKECDAVYKVVSRGANNAPYTVAPGQETHPQISIPAPWGNEKVQAIAFKTITDNRAVLHHWILNGGGAFLTGWAPGEDGIKKMLPDMGMNMPSGNLTLDMHYNSLQVKTSQTDASGVEICVVKEPHFRPKHVAVTMSLAAIPYIPNNAVMMENKGSCTLAAPVNLLTASPHAHTLARRMLFTVKKKNGQTITMHDMPFMFGEQKSYQLDAELALEAGDVINTSCFFTNNTGRTVTFGEDTGNEMCFNFASYYPAGALSCRPFGL